MASFDTDIFIQKASSLSLETTADVSVRHIPGGNISYIDLGGNQADKFAITAYFATTAARAAIRAKVGTQGSLVYQDGTVMAILVSMRQNERYPGDQQFADLEFLLVAA